MAHYFVLGLPHNVSCFVMPIRQTLPKRSWDGHVSTFGVLGGLPQSIL